MFEMVFVFQLKMLVILLIFASDVVCNAYIINSISITDATGIANAVYVVCATVVAGTTDV